MDLESDVQTTGEVLHQFCGGATRTPGPGGSEQKDPVVLGEKERGHEIPAPPGQSGGGRSEDGGRGRQIALLSRWALVMETERGVKTKTIPVTTIPIETTTPEGEGRGY